MVTGALHGPVVGTIHTEISEGVAVYFGDDRDVDVVDVLVIVWGGWRDGVEGIGGGLVVDSHGGST